MAKEPLGSGEKFAEMEVEKEGVLSGYKPHLLDWVGKLTEYPRDITRVRD
jgi:hypothetical protein